MIAATRSFAAAMRPFSTGASYLNFTHEPDRVQDAYGDDKYARLVALKDTYDPTNLFRLNQNIRPSQTQRKRRSRSAVQETGSLRAAGPCGRDCPAAHLARLARERVA